MNPLIQAAKDIKPTLDLNEAVSVPSTGALRARNVIFVSPPTGFEVNDKNMKACYQSIFKAFNKGMQQAAEQEGDVKEAAGRKRTLAISSFSTGAGGANPKKTAELAIGEVARFVMENDDTNVHIVCYDKATEEIYKKTLKEQGKGLFEESIKIVLGNIEQEAVDAIICPIQRNYDLGSSGPTAHAIIKLAGEKINKEAVLREEIPMELETTKAKEAVTFLALKNLSSRDPSKDDSFRFLQPDHPPTYEQFKEVFPDPKDRYVAMKKMERGYERRKEKKPNEASPELTFRQLTKIDNHFETLSKRMREELTDEDIIKLFESFSPETADKELMLSLVQDLVPDYAALKKLLPKKDNQQDFIESVGSMGGKLQKHAAQLSKGFLAEHNR